jgi:uncharacterized membrane protein
MKLLAPPRHLVLGVNTPPVLATLGTILTFVLVNLEIADAFKPAGAPLHLGFTGHFPRDMSYPISWSLFAVALLFVGVRRRLSLARSAGVALLAAVVVRLVLGPPVLEHGARTGNLVFLWLFVTYGAAAACFFVGARLLAHEEDRIGRVSARALLAAAGTLLAFVFVNLVIADHFAPFGQDLSLEFSGNRQRDMYYTLAWALFAAVLLVIGIRRRLSPVRYAAIALLCLTFLKLIFNDLWNLDAIYKIAVCFAMAVVAIASSFLYQRFLRSPQKEES